MDLAVRGNKCCSFNYHPQWFYRKLLAPTEEPIIMKAWLDEHSQNEELAKGTDIYVLDKYIVFFLYYRDSILFVDTTVLCISF